MPLPLEPPLRALQHTLTMSPARFSIFTALAALFAGLFALSEPADASLIDGSARIVTALSAMRLSSTETSNAMALAGFVVLACSSSHALCGQ